MQLPLREPLHLGATLSTWPAGLAGVYEYNGFVMNDRRVMDRVVLEKVTGFDDPDVRDSREDNPDRDGETAFDAFYSGRTITLQGYIRAGNYARMLYLFGALKSAFNSLTESTLSIRYLDWKDIFQDSNCLVDYGFDQGIGTAIAAADLSGLAPTNTTTKRIYIAPGENTSFPAVYTNLITDPSAEGSSLSAWASSVPTRTNLFLNPSFEVNTTGWSVSTGSITRDTGWGAAGSASGRTTGTVTSNDVSTFSAAMTVTAGLSYSASISYKIAAGNTASAASGGPRLIVQFDDGSNAWALTNTATATITWPAIGAMGTLSLSGITAPVGATRARFRVTGNTTGSQTVDVYWDAALLIQATTVPTYFDGDTPGYGWTGTPHASTSSNTATITNLVTNPSFETGVTSWSAAAAGFVSAGATLSQSSAQAYSGTSSAFVQTIAGTANQGIALSLSGTFSSGVTYTARCRVRGAAGGEPVKITLGDSGAGDSATSSVLTSTTSWQEISATWTPSANRTTVTVAVLDNGTAADNFYVDTVGAFASANNAGYFDGTSPGASWSGTAHASTSTRSAAGLANLEFDPSFDGSTATGTQYSTNNISAISRSTTQSYNGTQSLSITASGAGAMTVGPANNFRPQVVGGGTYSVGIYVRSSTTVRTWNITIRWFDSANAQIGGDSSAGANATSTSTGWTLVTTTNVTAPAGAVRGQWRLNTTATPAAGEVHYVDGVMFSRTTVVPAFFYGNTTGAFQMGSQSNGASILPVLTQSSDWAASGMLSARYSINTHTGESTNIDGPSFSVGALQPYSVRTAYNISSLAGSADIRVRWSNGSTSLLATVSSGTGVASATVTSPAGATSATIRVVPGTTGLTDMYIDALMAVAGSTLPSYFDGSLSGYGWTGTANASTSVGPTPPLTSGAKYNYGDCDNIVSFNIASSMTGVVVGPMFRRTTALSYLRVVYEHASTQLALYKTVNGVDTLLDSTSITLSAATNYWIQARVEGTSVSYSVWSSYPSDFETALASKTFTLSGGDQTLFPSAGVGYHSGVYWTPNSTSDRVTLLDVGALNPGDAQISCRKISKIESDEVQEGNSIIKRFMITLRASNPRLVSRKLTTSSQVPSTFSMVFPGGGGGLTFPSDGSGLLFGAALGTVTNYGRATALPIVRMYGPMTNPTIACSQTSTRVGISGSIADGDYFDFDCFKRTVIDSAGASKYSMLTSDTNWISLAPGSNQIVIGADSVGGNGKINFYFRHSSL